MYKKGDFHIHTTFSDGSFTPKEIIKKAKIKGLDIIAITDHNSVDGVHEAIEEGNKEGIKVIPGVEISSRVNNIRVHVLGYFKEGDYDERLIIALNYIRTHNNNKFDKFIKDNFNISFRRDHICVEKAITLIKYFNGVAILAHPVLISRKYFSNIINLGFHGLEAKYCKNTQEDTEFFINFAKTHGMIYTAGSDYHRTTELYRAHGNLGDVYLNGEEIKIFLNFLYKK